MERAGVHDNFFDLGGHSLLAVRLIARVEKQFGKKLTLASIFQSPTIQDQADAISRPGSLNKVPGVIPIQPEGSGPPFFCFGAGPLFRPLALRLGTEHPFLGLGLDESEMLELPAPFKLEDIAAPLVAKLRKLQPEGPYSLGGWCEDGVVAFEAAQQLVAQGQSVALLALFDTWNPAAWQSLSRHRAFQVRLHHRAQKLKYHSSNLRGLEPKKVYEYLADRWNTQLKSLGNRIWRAPRFPQTRSSNPAPNRAIEG